MYHEQWRAALPKPDGYEPSMDDAAYFEVLIDAEAIRRAAYYRELGRRAEMLGFRSTLEPALPALEPFHPFDATEITVKLVQLGFANDVATDLVRAGVSVLSRRMLRGAQWHFDDEGSYADDMLAEIPGDLCAVDPLYAVALWRHGAHTANRTFAAGAALRRLGALPPDQRVSTLRNSQDLILGEGVSTGRALFGGWLHAAARRAYDGHEVAEYVVQDRQQFDRLISRLYRAVAQNSEYPDVQLWFRGQTADHPIPDRAALDRAAVLPYSLRPESSVVPSLYRVIDKHTDSPERFYRLARHVGDWAASAAILTRGASAPPTLSVPPVVGTIRVSAIVGGKTDAASVVPGPGLTALHEHLDGEGRVVAQEMRDLDPGRRLAESGLALQHYGCKTSWIDLTKDADVALWFALTDLRPAPGGGLGALMARPRTAWSGTDRWDWPTVFVFALMPDRHPFLDTENLLAPAGALRPVRQRCGLLGGAANLLRNYGARLVALKIRLAPGFQRGEMPPGSYYFPDRHDDPVLDALRRTQDQGNEPPLFPAYYLVNPE
jgi:hypothetical protein